MAIGAVTLEDGSPGIKIFLTKTLDNAGMIEVEPIFLDCKLFRSWLQLGFTLPTTANYFQYVSC